MADVHCTVYMHCPLVDTAHIILQFSLNNDPTFKLVKQFKVYIEKFAPKVS